MTKRTEYLTLRLFPSAADMAQAEARKAQYENEGWTLTRETITCLTYEK